MGDPRGIRSSSSSSTSRGSRGCVRDPFKGEDFLEGGRGRGITLWLDANSGVVLRSLLFGVTRPKASISSTSSNPPAAPRSLTWILFAPYDDGPGPKTPCFFTGVSKPMGISRPSGRVEVVVFRRFIGGRTSSVRPACSSTVVGGEGGRNRFVAATRCTSWDSGVVSPNTAVLLGSEKGGRTSAETDGSSSTPGRFLGVEVTACENDGGINP